MALDEYIYGKVSNYFKRRKKSSIEGLENAVKLDDKNLDSVFLPELSQENPSKFITPKTKAVIKTTTSFYHLYLPNAPHTNKIYPFIFLEYSTFRFKKI